MPEKKKISNWRFALLHYLLGGLSIPLLTRLIVIALILILSKVEISIREELLAILLAIIVFIADFLPVCIGARFSAKYFTRKYFIDNKNKVIGLSLIMFMFLSLIFTVAAGFIFAMFFENIDWILLPFASIGGFVFTTGVVSFMFGPSGLFGFVILGWSIPSLLFFICSKKYILREKVSDSKITKKFPLFGKKQISIYGLVTSFLVFVVIFGMGMLVFDFLRPKVNGKAPDARIVSAISQARTVMTYLYNKEGNYDDFNCEHEEMIALCQEIDVNYGPDDDAEPIIAHDAPDNSRAACIYSPLNTTIGGEKKWYCADSLGYAGATTTDPGTAGCSMTGGAVCPAGLVNP